jgi:hypothetical protein
VSGARKALAADPHRQIGDPRRVAGLVGAHRLRTPATDPAHGRRGHIAGPRAADQRARRPGHRVLRPRRGPARPGPRLRHRPDRAAARPGWAGKTTPAACSRTPHCGRLAGRAWNAWDVWEDRAERWDVLCVGRIAAAVPSAAAPS